LRLLDRLPGIAGTADLAGEVRLTAHSIEAGWARPEVLPDALCVRPLELPVGLADGCGLLVDAYDGCRFVQNWLLARFACGLRANNAASPPRDDESSDHYADADDGICGDDGDVSDQSETGLRRSNDWPCDGGENNDAGRDGQGAESVVAVACAAGWLAHQ
jgi:hypothetical protein